MKTNHVTLIGYVAKDLISTKLPTGAKQVRIRIATHYSRVSKEGEKVWHTQWHDVIAWNKKAEYAERSFVKGSKIMIQGAITYRTYPDKTGHIRYVTEITAHSLMNLDR
ncbi:MAG: single-stranded DNA-binding protein [Niabella sp.]